MKSVLRAAVAAVALTLAASAPAAPAPADGAASAPPQEIWSIATRKNEDGSRAIIYRFIDDLGPRAGERATQPDRVTLTWRYDADVNNGMPTPEDRERMDELEDLLEPAVEMVGFANLALVRTGEGQRTWTYYTRSGHEFLERMKAVLPGHPQFAGKVKVDVAPDPGWKAYADFRDHVER